MIKKLANEDCAVKHICGQKSWEKCSPFAAPVGFTAYEDYNAVS